MSGGVVDGGDGDGAALVCRVVGAEDSRKSANKKRRGRRRHRRREGRSAEGFSLGGALWKGVGLKYRHRTSWGWKRSQVRYVPESERSEQHASAALLWCALEEGADVISNVARENNI